MQSKYGVAIISAPREPMLIGQSLDSYPWDLLPKPYVFAEARTPEFANKSKVHYWEHTTRLGHFKNFRFAASYIAQHIAPKWTIICEDDICWLPGAAEKLVEVLDKCDPYNIGFVSPYCSRVHGIHDLTGWQEPADSKYGWCGNLVMCFPHKSLVNMLKSPKFTAKNPLDYVIGQIFEDKKKLVHMPTLIRHLGHRHSTLMNNNSRNIDHIARLGYDCTN